MTDRSEQRARAKTLQALHHGPRALILVNAWDVASALVVERAGLPAVATSSSAVATSLGYPDGEAIGASGMLAAIGRIAARLRVPLTADFEAGYERDLDALADLVRQLTATGAVGLNLEDGIDPTTGELVPTDAAAERVATVRRVADEEGVPLVINARTDVFLVTTHDREEALREAITRLIAYREAGADCLFPIGVRDPATIAVLVHELEAPVNVLAGPGAPSIRELEALGVARVSLGGGPQRAALTTLARIADEAREAGTYRSLEGAISHHELDELVAAGPPEPPAR